MYKRFLIASASALALSGAAHAATATATTDLNLRAGPGPNYEVASVIDAEGTVEVNRCLESGSWCEVTYNGTTGWAYAEYLTATVDEEPVVISQSIPQLEVTTVQQESVESELATTGIGVATGAIAGALLAGPLGAATATAAAVGGLAGGVIGADASIEEQTVTYIRENPVEPVYLEGEVVVGAGIPEEVEVHQVPEAEYQYAYINGLPVVVDPETRQIIYVVR